MNGPGLSRLLYGNPLGEREDDRTPAPRLTRAGSSFVDYPASAVVLRAPDYCASILFNVVFPPGEETPSFF